MGKRFVGEREVSEVTGRSVSSLRADRHYGRGLPYIRLGRQIKYDLEDVYERMNKNKIYPDEM